MKKSILLLFIFLIVSIQFSTACTCGGTENFCEDIRDLDGNILERLLIIRGKVSQKDSEGLDVDIQETLFGIFDDDEIYIPQGHGIDCSMFINDFEVAKEYIFSLDKRSHNNEYYLSICQVSFLEIENEVIYGNIASGIESIGYQEFGDLEGCGNGLKIFSINYDIAVFPNPTNDILKIKNLNSFGLAENVRVECFDILGREHCPFIKEDGILAGETWTINLESLSSGIYFFKLFANQQEAVYKIMKE